jgi:hypothetical protein
MTELSKKDRILIELTVRRIDFKLDGRVPWRKRRQIRDELRANLLEAARDKGAAVAVEKLGSLNAIADSYLEVYRGRFDFQTGSYWALATYAAIQIVGVARSRSTSGTDSAHTAAACPATGRASR